MNNNVLTLQKTTRLTCAWVSYRQSTESTRMCVGGHERTKQLQSCILLK